MWAVFFEVDKTIRTPPHFKNFIKEFQRNFIKEFQSLNFIKETPNEFEVDTKYPPHFILLRFFQSLNFIKEIPNKFEVDTENPHFILLKFSQSLDFIKEIPNEFEVDTENPQLHFIKVFPVIEFYSGGGCVNLKKKQLNWPNFRIWK